MWNRACPQDDVHQTRVAIATDARPDLITDCVSRILAKRGYVTEEPTGEITFTNKHQNDALRVLGIQRETPGVFVSEPDEAEWIR